MEQQPVTDVLQGSVILKPLEAKLERNLHAFIKMDPYCVGMVGSTFIKGKVCKNGGLNPYWTDAILLQLRNDLSCLFQVRDRQILVGDSTIGVCEIDIKTLMEEKTATKWYDLYFMKKFVGRILIDATYTEENYGSRHIVYTKLKHTRPVPDQTPSTIKMAQKHIPGPQDTSTQQQETMRGSVKSQLSGSPSRGQGSGQKEQLRNSPGQQTALDQGPEAIAVNNNGVVSTLPVQDIQAPKKKKWKLMSSIKKMFKDEKKDKTAQLQQTNEPAADADGLVPFKRRKPEGEAQFASVGGAPTNPNPEILERNVPAVPKPTLKDYLQKENLNQNVMPQPVRTIRDPNDKGLIRATQPVAHEDSHLKDQYRSVGHQDLQELRKAKKEVRISDMLKGDFSAQGAGEIEKMTPDWKSNTEVPKGFFAQPQEVNSLSMGGHQPRRFDEIPNRELYKYR